MNRSWITALTMASLAVSGGAFAGVIAATSDAPPAVALPESPALAAALVQPTTPALTAAGMIAYQVGEVGTITLSVANGQLSIGGVSANDGWTTAAKTADGSHVDVQFTDTSQLVTFTADLAGTNVLVSVTNVASPTTPTTSAPAPATPVPTAADPTPPRSVPTVSNPSVYADDHEGDDGHEHEDHDEEFEDD